jgi:hypothetical protein
LGGEEAGASGRGLGRAIRPFSLHQIGKMIVVRRLNHGSSSKVFQYNRRLPRKANAASNCAPDKDSSWAIFNLN